MPRKPSDERFDDHDEQEQDFQRTAFAGPPEAVRSARRTFRTMETVLLASTACLLAAIAWPIATDGLRRSDEPHTPAETGNPTPDPEPVHQGAPRIQIALLLDTSGSMDGLIDQARSQLWSVVNALDSATFRGEQPRLEIALYEYGNDSLEASDGWIRQVQGFTSELDVVSQALFSLTPTEARSTPVRRSPARSTS